MTRIATKAKHILHDGKDYGSSLLAYPGEDKGLGGDTAKVCSTPHNIDLLAAVGGSVMGCEVKRMRDFVDSWFGRRLHRQLRTLLAVVDIPVLVVRDFDWDEMHELFKDRNRHMNPISKTTGVK